MIIDLHCTVFYDLDTESHVHFFEQLVFGYWYHFVQLTEGFRSVK